ncbi:MAG: S4 domain-containing protein [Vulcanimicrobiaceae bacterium]
MRLDKFLKVARLAKRRTEAKDALDAGRIVEPKSRRTLKAGHEVRRGDVLEIHYARKVLTVEVIAVPERVVPGIKPLDLYTVLSERKEDPVEWL